uniref:DUF775 domain-containing protein n=1 Tax=Rhabditophanes sp. KR3021 TaxID=114890 RepID=A0AC35TFY7_9BILA
MASNVFASMVIGRAVNTGFEMVSPMNFVCNIQDTNEISYIVVFLTGAEPFPAGFGGSIYMRWSNAASADPAWHYLGAITNEKPSAMFKVSNLNEATPTYTGFFGAAQTGTQVSLMTHNSCQIGLQVESIPEVDGRVADKVVKPSNTSEMTEFCKKMISNAYNYCQSFITTIPDGAGSNVEVIPAKVFEQWFVKYETRLNSNPKFWKNMN